MERCGDGCLSGVSCEDVAAKTAAEKLGTPSDRITLIESGDSRAVEFDSIYRKLLDAG